MPVAVNTIFTFAQSWLLRRRDECLALVMQMRTRWYLCLPLLAAYGWALDHIRVNVSHSLPYTMVYVEHAPGDLRRGDLVVYRFAGGEDAHYANLRGAPFFKRIGGVAGDRISVDGREVRVNDEAVGYAKPRSWDDTPLGVIRPGVIPLARFYMQGDSPDSFDSRYADNGLIRAEQIAARAWVIF